MRQNESRLAMIASLVAGSMGFGGAGAAHAQALGGPQYLKLSAHNTIVHEFCLGPCLCVPHSTTGALTGSLVAIVEADFPPVYSNVRLANIHWAAQTQRGLETLTGTGTLESFGDFVLQRRLQLTLTNDFGSVFHFDSDMVMGGLPLVATSPVVICDRYTVSIDFFEPRCAADFNADGSVNPDDLADFIAAYFNPSPGARADHNVDGRIDPDDLSDFIVAFFDEGCV